MKIEAKYKPELCVSTDETRAQLTQVQLDAEKNRMVATNGHLMVVVPIVAGKSDKTGPVSPEALKAARKFAGKASEVEFSANGHIELVNGATFPRPDKGQFPAIDQVIPAYKKGTDGTITIGLNAKYLLLLAEALCADKKMPVVHITIQLPKDGAPMLDPYVVTTDGHDANAFGVLMPTRVK